MRDIAMKIAASPFYKGVILGIPNSESKCARASLSRTIFPGDTGSTVGYKQGTVMRTNSLTFTWVLTTALTAILVQSASAERLPGKRKSVRDVRSDVRVVRSASLKTTAIKKGEAPAALLEQSLQGSVAGAANDLCANQTAISGEAAFAFNNSTATLDGPDHAACSFANATQIEKDVWFCVDRSCDALRRRVCGIDVWRYVGGHQAGGL